MNIRGHHQAGRTDDDCGMERIYHYRYLGASPDSQPIVACLGFTRLARTTPCLWDRGTSA